MVSERDRIEKLKQYIEQNGVEVNVGKNKARGNKGIFVSKTNRIDISKNLDEASTLSTLLHEFAHFVHYKNDNTLNSYDFIFPGITDDMLEELIKISVDFVSAKSASDLFKKKESIKKEIYDLADKVKNNYPSFNITKPCKEIEKTLSLPEKYLLRYDRVKYFNRFLSIEKLDNTCINSTVADYLTLKSRQRLLRRINSRITRLNKYYNKPTELIARFIELYYTDNKRAKTIAPLCCKVFEEKQVKEFENIMKIIFN